jgi:hypothetical protein
MSNAPGGMSTGKAIAIVIVVAVITSGAVTLAQVLISGRANTGVTGGIVGAITAATAFTLMKKKSA